MRKNSGKKDRIRLYGANLFVTIVMVTALWNVVRVVLAIAEY